MTTERTVRSVDSSRSTGMTRRDVLAATGVAGVALVAGCLSDDGDADTPDTGDIEIRYIPHGSGATDPFWETQERGWDAAVEQLGVDGRYQGPREEDFVQQVENIESAIDAGVDGLAVTLPDPDTFRDALERAAQEDVYVIVTNVTEEDQTMPWHGYIGQEEAVVGEELATEVLPLFEETAGNPPSEAVIANHSPGHQALELRQGGIEGVLDGEGIQHDWLDVPEGDPSGVVSNLASHKESNPDVDLVFTLGPVAGEPALDWIADEGLDGEVYHAGVDISESLANGIEDGTNLAQVVQQPFLQGYLAAQYLTTHLVYGILTPEITPTGPSFVSEDNLDTVKRQIEEVGVA